MNFEIFLLLVTIVLTTLLAIYIFARNPKGALSRIFILLILSFAFWSIVQLLLYMSANMNDVPILRKITYIFGIPIGWSFLYFALQFPYVTKDFLRTRYVLAISSLSSALFIFCYKADIIFTPIEYSGKGLYLSTPIYWYFVASFLAPLIVSYIIFYKKLQHATGDMKYKLLLIVISSSIAVFFGSLFDVIFPYFGILSFQLYGPSFTLVFTITVSYIVFLDPRRT